MKKLLVISLAVIVLALGAAFAKDKGQTEPAMLTGVVVDLGCYAKHAGKKPSDLKCAKACIASGGAVGILSEKTLYLAFGNAEESAQEMLADHAGQEVTVKGAVSERNGLKTVRIESLVPSGGTRSNMGFRQGEQAKP